MIRMKHLMIAAFGAVLMAPNLLFPLLKMFDRSKC